MPLRPLSYREVRRKLIAAGFAEVSQRGSNVKFLKADSDGRRTAIVPVHGELSRGILRSIIRQAGLTPEEFVEL